MPFDKNKILTAIGKSADRAMVKLTDKDKLNLINNIKKYMDDNPDKPYTIAVMHNLVETELENINSKVAKSYRDYRNYKIDFVKILDEVYKKAQNIMYIGDKENSNTDSSLVTTKRSLIYNELNKELYNKFFLTLDERQACRDGYIYIHDKSARRDTMNCCLFDAERVMTGGFEMGNLHYSEPKSIDTACDVLGDIIMMSASMQYGGWSTRVDNLLSKYCKKSFDSYLKYLTERYYASYSFRFLANINYFFNKKKIDKMLNDEAIKKTVRDLEQGVQGLEYKLNSVASSRGDYPFVTFALGLDSSFWGKEVSKAFLRVRKNGQGKEGFKKPVLFPKLVFLYDKLIHQKGYSCSDVFEEALECSSKCMYPDYLSLTGEGYVPSIYKKYGKVIYPMGCRAFLSPWFERGGMNPADANDTLIFTGRFNIGAVTLHLPMIYQKAKTEGKDFYKVLDYYLEMIRNIHKRTYEYLGKMKASTNPLGYCEGGFLRGNLKPNDCIKPLLKPMTASFGITALNELEVLATGKPISEDGSFSKSVMEYINKKANQFKEEDGILYAIYGTPAESLCGLQITQFRNKYGIIKGVSDKPYTTNSFHCHVSEDISPIEKQDKENKFWDLFNGGKIQYVKYPISYNKEAIRILVERAMKLGYYEGVNLSLSYCNNCGHEELNMEKCPKCGSSNLTKIDRMNGYLSYSRVNGDTRLNKAKMAEIADRKSM